MSSTVVPVVPVVPVMPLSQPAFTDARQCPWCTRWVLKDAACNFCFACGLDDKGVFHVGAGCGRSFCFLCGKRLCTPHHDMWTGERLPTARDNHDEACCVREAGFVEVDYCEGGHNSHCGPRFLTK